MQFRLQPNSLELKTSVLQIADNLYNFSEKLRLEEQKKTCLFFSQS